MDLYRGLALYGGNIIASEGDDWKKTKKVAAPAFSEVSLLPFPSEILFSTRSKRNNKLVWAVSVRVMDSLHNEIWKDRDIISIDHFAETTVQESEVLFQGSMVIFTSKLLPMQIAMFVIATAGNLLTASSLLIWTLTVRLRKTCNMA